MPGYALKSLLHHRLRLVISVLGIAIAIALILIINGFAEGFYKQASSYYRNIPAQIIVAENDEGIIGSATFLSSGLKKTIKKPASVTNVSEILFVSYVFQDSPIILIGFDKKAHGPWQISQGGDIKNDKEVVLDKAFADEKDIELNDKITLYGKRFKVVGLSAGTTSFIAPYNFISLKTLRTLVGSPKMTSNFLVKVTNVKKALNSINKNLDVGKAFAITDIAKSEEEDVKQVMSGPISMINLIALLIGLLVIALTAYVTTLSKIAEFGILKAIGSNISKLFAIVLKQTFINTILGLAVGIGLGFIGGNIIQTLYPKLLIYITPISIIRTSALAVALALLASVIPIRKVAAVDPVSVFK